MAGADANPYLVAAVVLAGMLHGIERRIDPGPPVEGNGYAQAVAGDLPSHWPDALERAARSTFSPMHSARTCCASSSQSSGRSARASAHW